MKALEHLQTALVTAYHAVRRRFWPRRVPLDPPSRILVLGYAAIGDLIFFLPVLEGLRRHYPEAKIVFVANAYATTDELLPASRLVDEVWHCDWEGPDAASEKSAINRRIHDADFDLAVLSLSSPMHFFQRGLRDVPAVVGHCRRAVRSWKRLLFTGELARRLLLDKKAWIEEASEHAVARNLRLLDPLDVPAPLPSRPPALPFERRGDYSRQVLSALNPAKRRVGVHLGPPMSQYHKIWAPERFARLCSLMARAWNAEILLVGTKDEQPSVDVVRAQCPDAHSWVGRASLLQTFAIVKQCHLFVSNDTGLAKAAMAFGVPTATILGLSDPAEVGVIWEKEKHLEIRTGIECSPCASLGMAKEGVLNYLTCGHHDCLAKLDVDFAWKALREKYGRLFA